MNWYNPFTWFQNDKQTTSDLNDIRDEIRKELQNVSKRDITPFLPRGRVSTPNVKENAFEYLRKDLKFVTPNFNRDVIGIIRKLVRVNPNFSQAMDNVVQLSNTSFDVVFDNDVKPKVADEMRRHLERSQGSWAEGSHGIEGVLNKLTSQIMISGALSNEWIPENDLSGIRRIALVNPEEIIWAYNKRKDIWLPFQKDLTVEGSVEDNFLIELNPRSYKYFALNGDSEIPYGIPPYMPALEPTQTQKKMESNIEFIMDLMGLLGFLEFLMDKPDMEEDESEVKYEQRLNSLLTQAKQRVTEGLKDGVVTGYEGDHQFNFHSTTKDLRHVGDTLEHNELRISSGLKMDASMLGRSYGTTETQITVVFSKLLAQLSNIRALHKRNLEYGLSLDLRLAGYNFNKLSIKFHQSTATDELKYQQSQEIKVRNKRQLYLDGIISQDQYAEEIGYDAPDQPEPREVKEEAPVDESKKKQDRKKDKGDSDKKTRSKRKERPRSERD